MRFPQQQEEMRQFMDRITPNNWNIFTLETGKYICDVAGTLNVLLILKDYTPEDDLFTVARVRGPMSFVRLNGIMTAKIEVWIYPHGDLHKEAGTSWKGTIIHELAHVAVYRCVASKKKAHKTEGVISLLDVEEEPHGPTFQRALTVMLNRAIAEFGDEVLEDGVLSELVDDLDYYEYVDPM